MADHTTKERLIRAGTTIFAQKGYRDATVAEICDKAEANIAAVNYHFGDKESLYDACWRHAFSITAGTYPIDGGLPEHPNLEDCIICYAKAILHRIFSEDEAGLFPLLLAREMVSPTLALEKIATDALFPQSEFLKNAIGSYLGDDTDEETVMRCMLGVISQTAFFNFNRGLRETVICKKTMTSEEIDRMARHIARFSIGGINEIKKDSGK